MTVIAYLICAFVWGTTWFAIRLSIEEGGFPTMQSAALRFSLAAVILAAIWLLGGSRPTPRTGRQWRWLALAGVFNTIGYSLVYSAEESVSGGLAAVLFGTFPLATAIIATITRTERVAVSQIAGALVALAGIGIIFSDRLAVSLDQALGIAMIVGAVFCSASYGVVLKREAQDVNPLASTTVFLGVTAVLLWILVPLYDSAPLPWPPPARASVAVLYLAIFGSVLTFASYIFLLKRISLMATTTLVFVQPLIAVTVDAFFEDEVVLTATTYVGMLVVLVGVFASLSAREWARRRSAGAGLSPKANEAETPQPKSDKTGKS